MRLAFLCITVGMLSLAACGDDGPTGPIGPNLVGTYEGTWTITVEGPGLEPTIQVCVGEVTVTEHSGRVFEGTFSQTASEDCETATGFVTGTVTDDGEVTVRLGASGGGWPGCRFGSRGTSGSGRGDRAGTGSVGRRRGDSEPERV
jgi:hypothetical protein